jgi:hypothetical protein
VEPTPYRNKLLLGCAFYGHNTKDHTLWSDSTKVPYATYSGGGFSGNRGDLPADVATKVNHCYTNGYGGVFAWELGYDLPVTNSQSLLNACPYITGPDKICPSYSATSGTFTAHNFPDTLTWRCSSKLSMTANGSTVTITNPPNPYLPVPMDINNSDTPPSKIPLAFSCPFGASTTGWVEATATYNGTTIQRTFTFIADGVCVTALASGLIEYGTHSVVATTTGPADKITWSWSTDALYNTYSVNSTFYYKVSNDTYSITATASNVCGGSSRTRKFCPNCITIGYVIPVYPNPASDILNIEIDQEAIAQAKAVEETLTDDKAFKTDITYDIRLYDGQGNLLRQQKTKGGTVQFNVSNLPGRQGEFHPKPPTEPYVKVSLHTARLILTGFNL